MDKVIRTAAVFCFFQFLAIAGVAQVEKFDIITYTAPTGWAAKKGPEAVQFSKSDEATGAFCIVTIYKSVDAGTDSRANFNAAWNALVTQTLGTDAKPQFGAPGDKDGWTAEMGVAPVSTADIKGAALLTTMSRGNKMLSVLVLTNSESFQKEIEALVDSIKLPPIKAVPAQSTEPATPATGESARLIGKWQRSSSGQPTYADPVSWGTAGYTKSRYEFKADGTYIYTERSFRMMMQTIIIVKENGKYSVNGNTLTVTPQKSMISSYKKDGGVDALGALVKSQVRPLEAAAYRFTFHFFEGIKEWNLVLQADKTTQRDGPFSNNQTFPNAWYFDQKYTDNDLTAPRN
ncbi:MAG: lipocalin family protein [Pyrinomonadaceae bacterium]